MLTPVLETERLILRPPAAGDEKPLFEALFRDGDVCRYTGYSPHRDIGETERFLRDELARISRDDHYIWCYEKKTEGELVGFGGVMRSPVRGRFELGFFTAKRFWGRGYTLEAAEAMLRFASETLGIREFTAKHAVGNTASGWVLKALGFGFRRRTTITKLNGSRSFDALEYGLRIK